MINETRDVVDDDVFTRSLGEHVCVCVCVVYVSFNNVLLAYSFAPFTAACVSAALKFVVDDVANQMKTEVNNQQINIIFY